MSTAHNIATHLEELLRQAAAENADFGPDFEPELRAADPRHGDFQANGVLGFARARKTNPRALAESLLTTLTALDDWPAVGCSVEIAGPGFLNFTLSPTALLNWLHRLDLNQTQAALIGGPFAGKTVIVDFSSPNTAKQMHVGHIRSTVIGESLSRMLAFSGATVIRDNHIGDWGTQFGIIIAAIKDSGYDPGCGDVDALTRIEQLYKEGNSRFKNDPEARDRARAELVKLQQGDAENTAIWEQISKVSWAEFAAIYDLLDVKFDKVLGESFYRDRVDRVCAELEELGIAQQSEGALVVFHPEHPRFKTQPLIIRKADGASNYATTDLATLLYRVEELGAEAVLYVVGSPQSDHFEQLFLTAEKWFKAKGYPIPTMTHVAFGTVLGEDGKAIKTRDGEPVKLRQLFNEAIERARVVVKEKSASLPDDQKEAIARIVGISAVRYADLSQNRTSDYVFAWEKLLSFDGNTAPYLLYAVARIHSIFRKTGQIPDAKTLQYATPFETPAEIALARKLAAFPVALELALADLRPHMLCTYLYELSGTFSSFYNADKVAVDDTPVRARRLLLCSRSLAVMETSLALLGIPSLDRM